MKKCNEEYYADDYDGSIEQCYDTCVFTDESMTIFL